MGERVAVDPVLACGACYPCSVGRPNVCHRLQVLGVHRDGGFSELLCVPAPNAHVVPAAISEIDSATIEPFAVAANVTTRTGVFPNDTALVYGAGPIGLMVLQVLKGVHGVRVLVTDRVEERLARALACGADAVVNTAREPLPDALRRLGVDEGPTLVIDAVCHPAILEEAVRLAAPAGRIGMLAFSTEPSRDPAAGDHAQGAVALCLAPQLRDVPPGHRVDGGGSPAARARGEPPRALRGGPAGLRARRGRSAGDLQGAARLRPRDLSHSP